MSRPNDLSFGLGCWEERERKCLPLLGLPAVGLGGLTLIWLLCHDHISLLMAGVERIAVPREVEGRLSFMDGLHPQSTASFRRGNA